MKKLNIFEEMAEACKEGLAAICHAWVQHQEDKVLLPISPVDLWDLSANNKITCITIMEPSEKGHDWRKVTTALLGGKPFGPGQIRFLEIVDEEALKSTGFLKGYAGGLGVWGRRVSVDEVQELHNRMEG